MPSLLRRSDQHRCEIRRDLSPRPADSNRTSLTILLGLAIMGTSGLSGCVPILVGGTIAGASAAYDRRHYETVIDDQQIELAAMHTLAQDAIVGPSSRISATSYNRTLLLTGQADPEAVAARAADLVSRLPKVERVVDEIRIGPPISLGQESEDALITSRAKLALTKVELPGFNPTRVKVVTEDATVYLMGLVTPAEAAAAAEQISYVPGVQQVVKLFEYDPAST